MLLLRPGDPSDDGIAFRNLELSLEGAKGLEALVEDAHLRGGVVNSEEVVVALGVDTLSHSAVEMQVFVREEGAFLKSLSFFHHLPQDLWREDFFLNCLRNL